jgi:putative membrane protein insertion efficiency factor
MIKRFLINSIQRYQETLSPRLYDRGVRCIYAQSCSHYAIAILERRNSLVACMLITFRILSCNPINAYLKRRELKANEIMYGEGI